MTENPNAPGGPAQPPPGYGYPPQEQHPTNPGYPPPGQSGSGGYPPPGFTVSGPSYPAGAPTGAPPSGTPTPPTGRKGGPLALGFVVGLVVAVAAGAVLLLTNVINWGVSDTASGPDTRAISLPETLAGNRTMLAVTTDKSKNPQQLERMKARQTHTEQLTVAAYQQAFGGAAADMETYADDDLLQYVTVIAVRGHAAGLTNGPVIDPADLGLATNPTNLIHPTDQIDCTTAQKKTTPAGKPVDPNDTFIIACQRTGPALTVLLFASGAWAEGPSGQARMVELTNAAWTAVSSGA